MSEVHVELGGWSPECACSVSVLINQSESLEARLRNGQVINREFATKIDHLCSHQCALADISEHTLSLPMALK